MCSPDSEYKLINPTTQIALFSICLENCSSLQNIIWKIYSKEINQTYSMENNWFFGINTSNFTSTNQLFLTNSQIKHWQFEVVYSFSS